MEVLRAICSVAALSGLIAGILLTGLHEFASVPLILTAETYEHAEEHVSRATSASIPDNADQAIGDASKPTNGFGRKAFTVLADVLVSVGFALLLVSAYALRGQVMNWRKGLCWGLAGFATFVLAPGLILTPTLPGAEAAPLPVRQMWWAATVVATGSGLVLLCFTRSLAFRGLGVVLLVLPHILSQPQGREVAGLLPAAMSDHFVAVTFVIGLLFWMALGSLTGFLYQRLRRAR